MLSNQTLIKPKAARAVGQACHANPLPILIPCHRVVGSGGNLVGFSPGVEVKRKLLALEAAFDLSACPHAESTKGDGSKMTPNLQL